MHSIRLPVLFCRFDRGVLPAEAFCYKRTCMVEWGQFLWRSQLLKSADEAGTYRNSKSGTSVHRYDAMNKGKIYMNTLRSCLEMAWWLLIVPLGLGLLPYTGGNKNQGSLKTGEQTADPMAMSLTADGYIIMFALFEVIAVPLILLQQPFHYLVWAAAAIFGALAVLSFIINRKRLGHVLRESLHSALHQPWTVYLALALILAQIAAYVLFMVIDLDDSFYVAAASTAMKKDAMYTYSAYTGHKLGYVPKRYGLSPFPMFLAWISTLAQKNAAAMAHTFLPVFLIPMAYTVYFKLGDLLFHGDRAQTGMMTAFIAWIHMFSYYSVYTQGTFLSIRIWQGKAVLAGMLLPFLILNLYKAFREGGRRQWVLAFLNVLACCMVSSMGIALSLTVLGIMTVVFPLWKREWKRLFYMILCGVPCAVLGACYLLL